MGLFERVERAIVLIYRETTEDQPSETPGHDAETRCTKLVEAIKAIYKEPAPLDRGCTPGEVHAALHAILFSSLVTTVAADTATEANTDPAEQLDSVGSEGDSARPAQPPLAGPEQIGLASRQHVRILFGGDIEVTAEGYVAIASRLDLGPHAEAAFLRLPPHMFPSVLAATLAAGSAQAESVSQSEEIECPDALTARFCTMIAAVALSRCHLDPPRSIEAKGGSGVGASGTDVALAALEGDRGVATCLTAHSDRVQFLQLSCRGLAANPYETPCLPPPPLKRALPANGGNQSATATVQSDPEVMDAAGRVARLPLPLQGAPRSTADLAVLASLVLPSSRRAPISNSHLDANQEPPTVVREESNALEAWNEQRKVAEAVCRLMTGPWAAMCGWNIRTATFDPTCPVGPELIVLNAWAARVKEHAVYSHVTSDHDQSIGGDGATKAHENEGADGNDGMSIPPVVALVVAGIPSSLLSPPPPITVPPPTDQNERPHGIVDAVRAALDSAAPEAIASTLAARRRSLTSVARVCAAANAVLRLRDHALHCRQERRASEARGLFAGHTESAGWVVEAYLELPLSQRADVRAYTFGLADAIGENLTARSELDEAAALSPFTVGAAAIETGAGLGGDVISALNRLTAIDSAQAAIDAVARAALVAPLHGMVQVLRIAAREPELQALLAAALAAHPDWATRTLPTQPARSTLVSALRHVAGLSPLVGPIVGSTVGPSGLRGAGSGVELELTFETAENLARFVAQLATDSGTVEKGRSQVRLDFRPCRPDELLRWACMPYLCWEPECGDRHLTHFPLALLEHYLNLGAPQTSASTVPRATTQATVESHQSSGAGVSNTPASAVDGTKEEEAAHQKDGATSLATNTKLGEMMGQSDLLAMLCGLCELGSMGGDNPGGGGGSGTVSMRHRCATLLHALGTVHLKTHGSIPPPFARMLKERFHWETLLALKEAFPSSDSDPSMLCPLPAELIAACHLDPTAWHSLSSNSTSVLGHLDSPANVDCHSPRQPPTDSEEDEGQRELIALFKACRSAPAVLRTALVEAFVAQSLPAPLEMIRAALRVLPTSDPEQTAAIGLDTLPALATATMAAPDTFESGAPKTADKDGTDQTARVNTGNPAFESCFCTPAALVPPPEVNVAGWVLLGLLRNGEAAAAQRFVPQYAGVVLRAASAVGPMQRAALWTHACQAARAAADLATRSPCGHQLLVLCFDVLRLALDATAGQGRGLEGESELTHYVRLADATAVLPTCPERTAMRKSIEERGIAAL